jgi:hypothetical protein
VTGQQAVAGLSTIVSLSVGALFANLVSVVIMLIDTALQRR